MGRTWTGRAKNYTFYAWQPDGQPSTAREHMPTMLRNFGR